jgi:hypothetical protein
MPIILATWEAAITRIMVQGQSRQKSSRNPISKEKKLGVVAHLSSRDGKKT